jgi:hypothetical protein
VHANGTFMHEQTEWSRFRLPVSSRAVVLMQPSGWEELLLVEPCSGTRGDAAVALAGRLARSPDGDDLDWARLCVPDLDAFILRLRQRLLGDRISADLMCPVAGCGQRIDIDFGIEQFLDHHAQAVGVESDADCEPADEPGWFSPKSVEGIRFRLPTVADQIAVASRPDADVELAHRCIQPAEISDIDLAQIEAAMEVLAPSLSSDLEGHCPACGAVVTVEFDARWFCMQELRQRAAYIHQEVDLLARRYHWSEAEILALPRARRAAYADLARQSGGH